jgi:hypothetical protein
MTLDRLGNTYEVPMANLTQNAKNIDNHRD